MTETIGGAPRTREFASGTAYEAFLRAEIAMARGDPDEASRQLELAMMGDPADGYLAARRAEVLLVSGHRDEALAAAREAAGRFPAQAVAWMALGEVLRARGEQPAASRAFTRALENAPDDPDVRAAVARAAGGSPNEVAMAMSSAPQARAGDRTTAMRMALDPLRNDRPTPRTLRQDRARAAMERGAYGAVEVMLAPLAAADVTDVADRVRLIEARAADGRPGDAARLVPGVPTAPRAHGVAQAEHARLWLLAARDELAVEEARAALAADATDVLARVVLGQALARLGHVAEGVVLLADVPPMASLFVEAQLAAAEALGTAGREELADAALAGAIPRVAADDAPGRDRLRIARAMRELRHGTIADTRHMLGQIESAWGRQRRGAVLLGIATPREVVGDLRVRSGQPIEDGRADAWRVLLCAEASARAGCDERERDAALVSARENAPEAPETLRALAVTSEDRRAGLEYLRAAALRDPLSPWNRVLLTRFGHRAAAGSARP